MEIEASRVRMPSVPALLFLVLVTAGAGDLRASVGFLRGDANGDGSVDLSDAVSTLLHLFSDHEISCLEAADADGSGNLNVTDAIYFLTFLFRGAEPPPPPWPECDAVREESLALGCDVPQCAEEPGGEPVWMARPDGCRQCSPCDAPPLEELVDELRAEGIAVLDSTMGSPFPVCLACEVCPSGRFYFVLVPPEDVPLLEERGWGPLDPDARRL